MAPLDNILSLFYAPHLSTLIYILKYSSISVLDLESDLLHNLTPPVVHMHSFSPRHFVMQINQVTNNLPFVKENISHFSLSSLVDNIYYNSYA
jgi:hypothetical protein